MINSIVLHKDSSHLHHHNQLKLEPAIRRCLQTKDGANAGGFVASEWLSMLQFDMLPHFLLTALQKAGKPQLESVHTLTPVATEWDNLCKEHARRMGLEEYWYRVHFPFQISADWAPAHYRGKDEMSMPRVSMAEEARTLWQRSFAFLGKPEQSLLSALRETYSRGHTAAFHTKEAKEALWRAAVGKEARDAANEVFMQAERLFADWVALASKFDFLQPATEPNARHVQNNDPVTRAYEFFAEFFIKGRKARLVDQEQKRWNEARKRATLRSLAEQLTASVWDRVEHAAHVRMQEEQEGMPFMAYLRRMLAAGALHGKVLSLRLPNI